MKSSPGTVRLPLPDETIAPVTIFDAEGRVVRVVAATEFHRSAPAAPRNHRLERRRRVPKLAGVGGEESLRAG